MKKSKTLIKFILQATISLYTVIFLPSLGGLRGFWGLSIAEAQNVGINIIGASPDNSAILDVSTTTQGFLLPRMTTAQRNAIASPAEALLIFNTDDKCFQAYISGAWISFGCGCQLPGSFSAAAASGITDAAFNANWNSDSGATTYYLDVATDAGFTSIVTGYNNLNAGNVTTYNVTGLSCETDYYYRVRAGNSCGTGPDSDTITVTSASCCSNAWNQKADFGGTARNYPVSFSIGAKGYIGTGGGNLKDFWEWDQATNTWTQKADFGGTGRFQAAGFSIGTKGYIGLGLDGIDYDKEFWEWDQATNVWTRKADFGGVGRIQATGFSIGTKGYIGMGDNGTGTELKDFWEYDQGTNTWTAKTNFPGTPRYGCFGFSIGTKGYIGNGYDGTTHRGEFYEYDQATNTWSAKANYGGGTNSYAGAFSIGAKGYVGAGMNGPSAFYEWDQATNTWTAKANFPGGSKQGPASFSIGGKGYIGIGASGGVGFYEYCP